MDELDSLQLGAVLLVEDDFLIRLDLADLLRCSGFHQVVEATTGDQALALLKACSDVAVVITDINMPGTLDGLQLAAWIKANRPELKVVILSAYVPTINDGAVQADLLVAKPIRHGAFVASVIRLLSDP